MKNEKVYHRISEKAKTKKLGQYFTPYEIADFMTSWVLESMPKRILDPAVGNGVFLRNVKNVERVGYEVDKNIVDFFSDFNDLNYTIHFKDFLISDWEEKYDGIVCNPPYNRFQALDNRIEVFNSFKYHLGFSVSGYTNQYALFLLKALYQLEVNGRLAFIIPSEFLNTSYGSTIKEYLINNMLLDKLIFFDEKIQVFEKVITTSCIVLVSKKKKNEVSFINIESIKDYNNLIFNNLDLLNSISYRLEDLSSENKWLPLLKKNDNKFRNLVGFEKFAKVKRGIATGDNTYFVFNKEKAERFNIPRHALIDCVTKTNDIKVDVFTYDHFKKLLLDNKNMLLFNGELDNSESVQNYIQLGVKQEVNKKYLTSHRNPWYQIEKKDVAPIWISVFSRNKIKVVYNEANVSNLTCFHSIYVNPSYSKHKKVLFAFLLTEIGQACLYENKRLYGDGLDKFEPNDINKAEILDFDIIQSFHLSQIDELVANLTNNKGECIDRLNCIFKSYLI